MPIQSFSQQEQEQADALGVPGYVLHESQNGDLFRLTVMSSVEGIIRQGYDGGLYFITNSPAPKYQPMSLSVRVHRIEK